MDLITRGRPRKRVAFSVFMGLKLHQRHRLTDINADTETGNCSQCGPGAPLYWRKAKKGWMCRNRDQYRSHSVPRGWREARARFVEEQQGRCAICGAEELLVLDHCHATGEHRAALCRRCNSGIGLLGDDPSRMRKAAEYVELHRRRLRSAS